MLILEETEAIGGLSRTVAHNGNRMDIGGHRFFSKDERITNWWLSLMPLQGSPASDDPPQARRGCFAAQGPDPEQMDIPAGTIRIRRKGSAGGHNGMKSILYHVGDENFPRLRIGIGRPLPGWTVVNHVLAPFSAEDAPKIREAIEYLLPALECVVTDGVDLAMNRYNPKKQKKKPAEKEEAVEAAPLQEEK